MFAISPLEVALDPKKRTPLLLPLTVLNVKLLTVTSNPIEPSLAAEVSLLLGLEKTSTDVKEALSRELSYVMEVTFAGVVSVDGDMEVICSAVNAGSFAFWNIPGMLACSCTVSHLVGCNEYSKSVSIRD